MIRLNEIMKQRGIFSKDIKQRFSNGQVTVNGDVVGIDFELSFSSLIEIEDFISIISENSMWVLRMHMLGIETLFNCNIKNDLTKFLEGFQFVKISKKERFIIKK